MLQTRILLVIVVVFIAVVPTRAHAQYEVPPSRRGSLKDELPGQPAHGLAFEHMSGYEAGSVNMDMPGQPGHGFVLQPLTEKQRNNLRNVPPPPWDAIAPSLRPTVHTPPTQPRPIYAQQSRKVVLPPLPVMAIGVQQNVLVFPLPDEAPSPRAVSVRSIPMPPEIVVQGAAPVPNLMPPYEMIFPPSQTPSNTPPSTPTPCGPVTQPLALVKEDKKEDNDEGDDHPAPPLTVFIDGVRQD